MTDRRHCSAGPGLDIDVEAKGHQRGHEAQDARAATARREAAVQRFEVSSPLCERAWRAHTLACSCMHAAQVHMHVHAHARDIYAHTVTMQMMPL